MKGIEIQQIKQPSQPTDENYDGEPAIEFQDISPNEKQANFKQLSTHYALENQYFMQDSIQDNRIHEYITPEQFYKLQKYGHRWNWAQFGEFFGYHFLFIFLIGPLAPYVLMKFTGKTILYNMCFLGQEKPFITATFIYLLSYFFTISYFLLPQTNTIFAEIVILWLLHFFRCVTYSAKYGSFPKEKISLYKNHRIPYKESMIDSFLYYYNTQTTHVIYTESWNSFKSHEFEPSLFFIDFFLLPTVEIADEINQLTLDLAEEHKLTEVYQPEPLFSEITCSFYGFGILAKFIREFELEYPRKNCTFFGVIVAFSISVFTLIYKASNDKDFEHHPLAILRMVALIILNTYLSSESLLFLIVGIRDLQRKMFLVIQCAHIISPRRKDHYLEKKVLPTINIISPASIKAWSMLRQVCLTYGYQFHIRTKIFFSFLIIVKIVAIVFLLLFLFNIIKVEVITALYVAIWTIIFVLLMVVLLLLSAEINSYFEEYRNLLEDLNNMFQDMQRMKKYYFCQNIVPKNFLHRKFVEQLSKMVNEDCSKLDGHIESINIAIDDAKRNLEFDARNSCIDFFQIPITYELLGKIGVAVGTLFGFAIQQWIQSQKNKQQK